MSHLGATCTLLVQATQSIFKNLSHFATQLTKPALVLLKPLDIHKEWSAFCV